LGFFINKDSSGSKKDDEEQKEEDGNLITIILFMETIQLRMKINQLGY
jgi:hypothetical protein